MKCQYHAVTSTTMRRASTERCSRRSRLRTSKRADPTSKVNGVDCREQINERTAGTGRQIKSARLPSSRQASHCPVEKTQAEQTVRFSQGKLALFPTETPGIELHRSQRCLPRYLPPGQLHCDAAHEQNNGIYQQQCPRQADRQPVPNIIPGGLVECRKSLAHDVRAGERNEQHDDRRDPTSKPSLARRRRSP